MAWLLTDPFAHPTSRLPGVEASCMSDHIFPLVAACLLPRPCPPLSPPSLASLLWLAVCRPLCGRPGRNFLDPDLVVPCGLIATAPVVQTLIGLELCSSTLGFEEGRHLNDFDCHMRIRSLYVCMYSYRLDCYCYCTSVITVYDSGCDAITREP